MPEQKRIFILDAMALIYRAFYALNSSARLNSKGMNTSAILGFANTLWMIISKEKPTHLVVACDSQAPTFRHLDYDQYKAHRQKMPDEIAASLPWIDQLLEAMRIPKLMLDGYEADDIIGTLVKIAEPKNFDVFMVSADKDLGQLITNHVFLYKPGKIGDSAEILGKKEICEKFGICDPKKIVDLLGLWGDASDNIPGIPGVGEKTAKMLLEQFSSVEEIIAHADEIKNTKLQQKVKENSEKALFSKQLATIFTDVPIVFDEESFKLKNPDERVLKTLLDTLELRNFSKRIFTDLSLQKKPSGQMDLFTLETPGNETDSELSLYKTWKDYHSDYHMITYKEGAASLSETLSKSAEFCFDTETTGLDANEAALVGMSFSINPGEAWFVAVPEEKEEAQDMVQLFKNPFENEKIRKIGQNMKFDISVLKRYGIEPKGVLFDTMIAHYLLQPERRHNMDILAEEYLEYKTISIEELIGKSGKMQIDMRQAFKNEPQKVSDYACEDADITLQLYRKFAPDLEQAKQTSLFFDIEMPLVKVLAAMEAEGVRIDKNNLFEFSKDLENQSLQIEKNIFKISGKQFNIASPKQLGKVLFEDLQIGGKIQKTKTGQYSTGEEVLQKLNAQQAHPIISEILDYRAITKLKSTYVDALPSLINPRDQRVHTSYNQTVTATGRLSSSNPNLQNIPIRTEQGREIRKAFVARDENYLLLAADYSQIELRIIAHISEDLGMKEDFVKGIDIHTATASRVFDVSLDQVSREQRRMAKVVNFGIIYGISAYGLSERLGISPKEARNIIEQYFIMYPGIKTYMDTQITFAREHGFVETLKGRRRYLPDIHNRNANIRAFAERNAINAPIQGSAADLIKIAMINVWNQLEHNRLKTRMILQVHDELVFDVHKSELENVREIVRNEMEHAMELSVPLIVDINIGNNWLEAH